MFVEYNILGFGSRYEGSGFKQMKGQNPLPHITCVGLVERALNSWVPLSCNAWCHSLVKLKGSQ